MSSYRGCDNAMAKGLLNNNVAEKADVSTSIGLCLKIALRRLRRRRWRNVLDIILSKVETEEEKH